MKALAAIVGGIVLFFGAIFALNYYGYMTTAFFAPRYEAVRRDQMIESRSYQEGAVRRLYDMQRQYQTAHDETERATIKAAARHEFSIFPAERLPLDLQAFRAMIMLGS